MTEFTPSAKFPFEKFPYRIEVTNEPRVCWFKCVEDAEKFISQHQLTKKDYVMESNNVETVGKSTRRKGTQKKSSRRQNRTD